MHLIINTTEQTLALMKGNQLIRSFTVSTAKNGVGQLEGTGCTPLGRHRIGEKIGDDAPIGSVFIGRVATGEIYDEALARANTERDWILTRILWLAGCEEGVNLGQNAQGVCDTQARYIYIHGTPDSEPMGVPLSHGCVRMRNDDIIWLYEHVSVDTPVLIV